MIIVACDKDSGNNSGDTAATYHEQDWNKQQGGGVTFTIDTVLDDDTTIYF